MVKSNIRIFTHGQRLGTGKSVPHYAGETIHYIGAHFDLDESWEGYDSVRAVWWNGAVEKATVFDATMTCIIPLEVVAKKGYVMVNLIASVSENGVLTDRFTSYPLKVAAIDADVKLTGSETVPVTPSQFEQFVEAVQNDADRAYSEADRATDEANRAEQAAEGAEASATDAQAAARSAELSAQTTQLAKSAAETAAANAEQSATDAGNYAGLAEAAEQDAQAAKTAAEASATAAAASETAAQTAQTAAEAAKDTAVANATTATTKAAEAAQSASSAADSETAAEAAATRAEQAAASLTVDSALSETSENPVQNKVVTGAVADLKSDLNDTQDWLGYPKNLLDARAFVITNTNNWSIDSATKTAITITHKTDFSTGYPVVTLDLPSGDYVFHADYTNSETPFSLQTNGTWVKVLTDGAEFTIDSTKTNRIYFSNSIIGTCTITDISITAIETAGKISDIESNISALQSSELATAQTVAVLQSEFNSIAMPVIGELTGEETQNKAISASGTLITAGSDYYRVIKYPVTVGKKYWVTACANWGNVPWCIYDSSDTPLLTGTPSERQSDFTIIDNEEVTAPVNSAYIIIAYQVTAKQGALKTQTGYKTAKWVGKKWVCVGDSLTAENIRTTKHYFDYVADATGITTVNMGYSGSGYARLANENHAFYQRISSCPTDADVVTIFGSFNDLGAGLPIGSVDDTGTDTLAGCINTTITNLQTVIPLVNLGIIAPTPWDTTQPATSGQDYNYVEMLKAICERRSIPFLDLWRSSNLRPWDADFRTLAYSKDGGSGTHPDENGHKLIAPRFKGFLETLLM